MRKTNKTSIDVLPLTLHDLLKRRKTTLKNWCTETGHTTYSVVVSYCERLGVVAPTLKEFHEVCPDVTTDQANGVVVFEIKKEQQPKRIKTQPTETSQSDPCTENVESPKKKRKTHVSDPEG